MFYISISITPFGHDGSEAPKALLYHCCLTAPLKETLFNSTDMSCVRRRICLISMELLDKKRLSYCVLISFSYFLFSMIAFLLQDFASNPGIAAGTVAHELGHNLGMAHDSK